MQYTAIKIYLHITTSFLALLLGILIPDFVPQLNENQMR